MKTIRFLVFMLFSACMLSSCSNDDDQGVDTRDDRIAVQFGTGNIAQTRTSADGTQWLAGDKIGIFMVNEGQSLSATEIAEGTDNVQYQAIIGSSIQSNFISVDASKTIYYPQSGNVDFIAYYPYKANLIDYTYPVDISNQSDPATLDVLYSNNATGKDKNSGTVALNFKHKLCRIVLNLSSAGSGMSQSSFLNLLSSDVSFRGGPVRASIDLKDGTVNPSIDISQTFNPIKTASAPTDYNAQFTAIIVPGAATGRKVDFYFRYLATTYTYNMSSVPFTSGMQYTFNLSFSRTGRSLAVESSNNEIKELEVTEIKQEIWQ